MREREAEYEQRVTSLELFFDLVFVFAITQVTGFLADNSTWEGLLRGLFLLGLALYFAAHVGWRLRIGGGWGHGRLTATIVLLALVPVATQVPAIVALALVSAVCAALIAYEALRYPYARSWIRSHRGAFTMEEATQVAGTRGRVADAELTSTDPNSGRPLGR